MPAPFRIVEFTTEYLENGKSRDWVLLAPSGEDFDKTQTWHRISHLTPKDLTGRDANSNTHKAMLARWNLIQPAYEKWKRGEELPEEGTPLAAWPGVNARQIEIFKENDIRTVEEVANMGDALLSKVRMPNVRRFPGLAKAWLEGQDASAKDAEIAAMRERMEAMEELLNEQHKNKPGKKESEAA